MDFAAVIRAEQQQVDAALAAGATYVIAKPNDTQHRVHTVDCPHVQVALDRAAAWGEVLARADADPEGRESYFQHTGDSARMLRLATRADVEALGTYRACLVCAPDTDHPRKTRDERPVKVANLTDRHFGRRLVGLDGTELGTLERLTIDRWPGRVEITVHTDTGSHRLAGDVPLLQRPAP